MTADRQLEKGPFWQWVGAAALDLTMCAVMNGIHWRHRITNADREALESYMAQCADLSRETYFHAPSTNGVLASDEDVWRWPSPVETAPLTVVRPRRATNAQRAHEANNNACVDLYPCAEGWSAPTVILLHALMSTSDVGYRRWARRFHAKGWNACFVHLPYHYSRKPPGFANGELAITADLVRTAEGLRAGVSEVRQVMAGLRKLGTREFGLWATSYGGWIGALLLSLENDFRWVALMTPILNIEHAIWNCPAGMALRHRLREVGIDHRLVARHAHLTSPIHGRPLCGGKRILFGAGMFDRISPQAEIARLAGEWDSELLVVRQGHFGYTLMPAVFEWLAEHGKI